MMGLSKVIEASSGTLLIVLIAMLIFTAAYLVRKLREFGQFMDVYVECKAAIATFVFQGGIAVWVGTVWFLLHLRNHGHDTQWFKVPGAVLISGALIMAVIGGICWIRLIAPRDSNTREKLLPHWTWLAILTGALIFGVGMAL